MLAFSFEVFEGQLLKPLALLDYLTVPYVHSSARRYTVRADGKRTGVVEKFWEDAGGELNFADHQNTFTWNYDDVGRLIGEALDSKDDTLDYTDAFVWDLTDTRNHTGYSQVLQESEFDDYDVAIPTKSNNSVGMWSHLLDTGLR